MADATVDSGSMTRREFLYYIWGASMALFAAQSVGSIIWFLIPKFKAGEFGGVFSIAIDSLPDINELPFNFPEGRFWLVNVDNTLTDLSMDGDDLFYKVSGNSVNSGEDDKDMKGVLAIYKVCTHLGCIYAWNDANGRFECPCHGSKYRLDGRRIEAPAPRDLDRFKVSLQLTDGAIVEADLDPELGQWNPVVPPGGDMSSVEAILVDTGDRIQGPARQLICDMRGNCP